MMLKSNPSLRGSHHHLRDSKPSRTRQTPAVALSHLMGAFIKLTHAEISLLKEEVKYSTLNAVKHLMLAFVFGMIAALGFLPLLASLVIALGSHLNHNYGLSSLIVSILFFSLGGLLSYFSMMKLIQVDMKPKKLRHSLESEAQIIRRSFGTRSKPQDLQHPIEKRAAS